METFVVRVWVPAAGAESGLRGIVERVGAGGQETFRNEQELVAIIAGNRAREPEIAGRENRP